MVEMKPLTSRTAGEVFCVPDRQHRHDSAPKQFPETAMAVAINDTGLVFQKAFVVLTGAEAGACYHYSDNVQTRDIDGETVVLKRSGVDDILESLMPE